MIFYGNGMVWNNEKDTLLCKFTKTGIRKGFIETTDATLIKKLKDLGYKHEYTEKDMELASKKNK